MLESLKFVNGQIHPNGYRNVNGTAKRPNLDDGEERMTMKLSMPLAVCLTLIGCRNEAAETLAVSRCESLLAAQELGSLPEALRSDSRAPIKPKGEPRISDGDRTTFVRRAYDRLTADGDESRIEPRDFTCKFDKKAGKVIELSTNGHTQEIRDSDDEWAIKQRASSPLQ